MPRRVRLNDEVRPDGRVSQQDLGQVRSALSRLGLFDPARDPSGSESTMSNGLRRALRTFQGAQGLREDATLRPRGPTEERLNRLLEQNLSLRADDALAARERTPGALAGRVGPGLENHPDDVAAVGAALRQLGHIPQGAERPLFTGSVFDGLKSFQRQNGLARDAVTLPGGPTERTLAEGLLTNLQRDPAVSAQLAQLERPGAAGAQAQTRLR